MGRGWIIVVEFFALIVLDVKSYYDLKISPQMSLILQEEGSNLLLFCEFKNAPSGAYIIWHDNNNSRVTRYRDGGTDTFIGLYSTDGLEQLCFRDMRKYYDGTYTCKLVVNGNVVEETTRQIELYPVFNFALVLPKQYLGLGMEGLIVCEPTAGVEKLVFRKELQLVTEGGRYSYVKKGLAIQNVEFTDAGNYMCEIIREEPPLYEVKDILVEVHGPVNITKEISSTTGIEGADFSLTCEASDPFVTFQFYLGGQILKNSSRINVNGKSGQVFFAPLRREDEGEVSCTAVNAVSMDNSTGYLTVQIPPSILSFPNMTYSEGENVTIECLAEGKPSPTLTVRKLSNSTYHSDHGTLNIKDVTPHASGLYICEAYSSLGSDSVTSTVMVKFKPRVLPNQKLRWTSFVYMTRNLTCKVEAYPPPSFQWFFNGVELSNNETFNVFSDDTVSHLQIYVNWTDQAWIYGRWEDPSKVICRATNSEGSLDVRMTFDLSDVPSELENVTWTVHPCQVDISYSPPLFTGDEILDRIMVSIFLNESRNFPWGNHLTMDKLKPNTYYEMRIYAGSIAGEGLGVDVEFTTPPPSVPYPVVLNRSKDVVGANYFRVEWEEPADTCLPIKKFKIRYRRVFIYLFTYLFFYLFHLAFITFNEFAPQFETDQKTHDITPIDREWSFVTLNDGLARAVNLTGLVPDSNYLLEVLAVNDIGSSKQNEFAKFKTAPSMVKGVADKFPVQGSDEDSPSGKNQKSFVRAEVLILIVVSLLFLFLAVVDVSCYATKRWGVLNYLMNLKKKNDSQSNKKKLIGRDNLPLGGKFNAPVRSNQEEFVTLTPVESDCKRSMSLSSVSRVTTSSDGSELGTFGVMTPEGNNTSII